MNIPHEYADRIRVLRNGCWLWTGGTVGIKNKHGHFPYGVIIREGKTLRVHRYFYELNTGKSAEGFHIHHDCDFTLCVNPDHLIAMTQAEHNRIHGKFRDQAEEARSAETCRHGHLWSETAYIWKGVRYCRECQAEAQRKRRKAKGGPGQGSNMRAKTHCPQGHPYEGDNLLIDSNGGRNCKICLRANSIERKRRYRERLKERAANPGA